MAKTQLAAAISGVVSCIQLQTDVIEASFGLHEWDSDDEESLVVLAGHEGLLLASPNREKTGSSSSSEEGSDGGEFSPEIGCRKWGKRRSSTADGAAAVAVKKSHHLGYFEMTVPLYGDAEFRQSFHLSRRTYEVLVRKLVPLMLPAAREANLRSGRPPIPPEKKVLIVLWFFATQQPFRLIAECFEVSKASVEDSYRKVVAALVQLGDEYIRWPASGDQVAHVASRFEEKTGLSHLLGVVGTARFGLKTTKMAPKFYSDPILGGCTVTSLFVCDHGMRFLDCYPGLPGSLSNVMVLRNSSLHARILASPEAVFPNGSYLIGDPSFPVEPWLITPFLDDGQLPPIKQAFNNAITLALNTRHRAIALLKGRFPRLSKALGIGRLDYLPACINVAFILHNVCLSEGEDEQDYLQEYVDAGWESAVAEFKATVGKGAGDMDVDADPDRWLQGCEKRNTVCNIYTQSRSRLISLDSIDQQL